MTGRRNLLALVAAAVVVAGAAGIGAVVRDGDRATDADRAALAAAAGADAPDETADAVARLAADRQRWARLAADGGDDLAALLDRGLPALEADDRDRARLVAAPVVAGTPVSDDVAPALGRWAGPLLVQPTVGDDDVVALLGRGGDEAPDDAVLAAVDVARARVVTGTVDAAALRDWHQSVDEVARRAGRTGYELLVGANGVAVPEATAAAVLAAYATDAPGEASAPLVDALDAWSERIGRRTDRVAVEGATVLRLASMLGAIDDRADREAADALTGAVEETMDQPLGDGPSAVHALEDAVLDLPEVAASEAVSFAAQEIVRA